MPISFVPETAKREKVTFRIPFFIWWIIIPLVIFGLIFYVLLQKEVQEGTELASANVALLSVEELERIEDDLKVFTDKKIQEIIKNLRENPFPKAPKVPSSKVGRSDPFKSFKPVSE